MTSLMASFVFCCFFCLPRTPEPTKKTIKAQKLLYLNVKGISFLLLFLFKVYIESRCQLTIATTGASIASLKLGGQVVSWRAAAARRRLLFCQNMGWGNCPPALPLLTPLYIILESTSGVMI